MSWGNTAWDQLDLADPPLSYRTSAFGHTTRTISMVTDGTSHTVFIAEIRQGSGDDIRGVVWTSVPGAGSFMSGFTPNSRLDIDLQDAFVVDELPDQTLCASESDMPCTGFSGQAAAFAGSRSRHPGGIHTLTGRRDGPLHQGHDRPDDLAGSGIPSME